MSDKPGWLRTLLCAGPDTISEKDLVVIRDGLQATWNDGLPPKVAEALRAGKRDVLVDVLYSEDAQRSGDGSFAWLNDTVRTTLNRPWPGKRVADIGLKMLYAGTNGCDCCAGWRVFAGVVAVVFQSIIIFALVL
jgi:hypothetical protein